MFLKIIKTSQPMGRILSTISTTQTWPSIRIRWLRMRRPRRLKMRSSGSFKYCKKKLWDNFFLNFGEILTRNCYLLRSTLCLTVSTFTFGTTLVLLVFILLFFLLLIWLHYCKLSTQVTSSIIRLVKAKNTTKNDLMWINTTQKTQESKHLQVCALVSCD